MHAPRGQEPVNHDSTQTFLKHLAILAGMTLPAISGCTSERPRPDEGPPPAVASNDPHVTKGHEFVRVPAADISRDFVQRTGFITDHAVDPKGQYVFGYMKREALSRLDPDLAERITVVDEHAFRHHHLDPHTLRPVPGSVVKDARPGTYEDYHDYTELKAELERIAREHPDILLLKSAGKSVEGRELYYVTISDNPEREEHEPNLLFIANMHGDEVVGRELMIYLIRDLVTKYQSDPDIKKMVDNAKIFIMPSMNPDGFEARSRFNGNDVDLNRAFPDFTSDPRDSATNREPEVKAIMGLHERHYFHLALNFHGGAVCMNIPWDTRPNHPAHEKFPEDPITRALAREYADSNPSMRDVTYGSFDRGVTYGYEWYEVDGGMQDWANYYRKSIHATVELSDIKWPHASTLEGFWNENKAGLVKYLQRGMEGLHIEVVDEANRPVEGVILGVDSSRRELGFSSNKIHRLTPPGEHQLTIKAPGFDEASLRLTSERFDGTFRKVVLRRSGE